METVSDALARIYDELDGIYGGEVTERTSRNLERAMSLISEAIAAEEDRAS